MQRPAGEALVSVRGLKKHFPILGGVLRRQIGTIYAVDGVDFDVFPGEVFAVVGESGCGKTTLGRTLLQLTPPTAGKVIFDGYELGDVDPDDMRPLRRRMQIIFQDPFGSLNPRMPVSDIIGEGLLAQGVTNRAERDKRVEDSLEIVGLRRDYTRRYPHEFSGGQRQRIGIARALALDPDFVVCDEPVSALDVSIQSQVLNLLLDLKRDFNLTYLFISHNLSVVQYFSDRVAVMYLGKIVELGTVEQLYREPAPSVHDRPALGDPGRGPAKATKAARPEGRRAVSRRAAVRLPLPHALLAARAARQARTVHHRGSGAPRHRRRGPHGGLPLLRGDQRHDRPRHRRQPGRARNGDRRRGMRLRSLGADSLGRGWRSGALLIVIASMLAIVVGCSSISASPTPAGTDAAQAPSGSGTGPLPTHWPGNVIEGLVQLAIVDHQFQVVGTDLNDAINAGDLKALLVVTKNVRTFLTTNQKYIPALQGYPTSKALGDGLAASYAQMIQGITQIEDSLTAGNGGGVTTGFATFTAGYTAYGAFRTGLGTLGTQALEMKRHFNL